MAVRYIKAGDPLPDLDPNYPQLGDRKGGWLPQNVYISNEKGRKLVFFDMEILYRMISV